MSCCCWGIFPSQFAPTKWPLIGWKKTRNGRNWRRCFEQLLSICAEIPIACRCGLLLGVRFMLKQLIKWCVKGRNKLLSSWELRCKKIRMEKRVLFCPLESKQKEEGRRKKEEGKCSRSKSFRYQESPKCQGG